MSISSHDTIVDKPLKDPAALVKEDIEESTNLVIRFASRVSKILECIPEVKDELLPLVEEVLDIYSQLEDCFAHAIDGYIEKTSRISNEEELTSGQEENVGRESQLDRANFLFESLKRDLSTILSTECWVDLEGLAVRDEKTAELFSQAKESIQPLLIRLEIKSEGIVESISLLEQKNPTFLPLVLEDNRELRVGDILLTKGGDLHVLQILEFRMGVPARITACYDDEVKIEADLEEVDFRPSLVLRPGKRTRFNSAEQLKPGSILITDSFHSTYGTETRRWVKDLSVEDGKVELRAVRAGAAKLDKMVGANFKPERYAYVEEGAPLYKGIARPERVDLREIANLKIGDILFFPQGLMLEVAFLNGKNIRVIETAGSGKSKLSNFALVGAQSKYLLRVEPPRPDGTRRGFRTSSLLGIVRQASLGTAKKLTERHLYDEDTLV